MSKAAGMCAGPTQAASNDPDPTLTVREAGLAIRHAERTIETTILDLHKKGLPVTNIGIVKTENGWMLTLHCEIEPRDAE